MKKEYPKHPKSATVALLEVRLIRSRRALLAAAELLRRFEERDRVAHELSLAQSERLRLRHLENLALREQIAVAGVSS